MDCPLCLEHVEKNSPDELINTIIRIKGDMNSVYTHISFAYDEWKISEYPNKKFQMHYDE